MNGFANHRRVNDILLGPIERPVLSWLADHMPVWVTPDTLTVIGLLGAVWTAVSYLLSNIDRSFLWLASIGFLINWFGDSLDGTLARHRHIERPVFGFFIDHTVDGFVALMIFLSLGLTPYVSFGAACLALIAYFLLSIVVYLRTTVAGEFKISYGRLGPTEIRAVAVLLNTLMFFGGVQVIPLTLGFALNPYDLVVGFLALVLFTFALVTAVRQTVRLAKEGK